MAFQTPITIKEALDSIGPEAEDDVPLPYALPAIQREFVWKPKRIEDLFESLMQGYPIGSFLYWQVKRSTVERFKWYDFITDYHERDLRHNPELNTRRMRGVGLKAIVDGQQRLTALNIGLRGSYTVKRKYKRKTDPTAYSKTFLYLNIKSELQDDESGRRYEFKFMTEQEFENNGGARKWFKVADIFEMTKQRHVSDYMYDKGLRVNVTNEDDANNIRNMEGMILDLREAVHTHTPICYELETSQDHDRILYMFIRANYFGAPLRYSDLLLSIATAHWTMNARKAVRDPIDSLNNNYNFRFPYEFILKAGLVIADIGDIRFKARNLNSDNARKLETRWGRVESSLRHAVVLAHEFGLSGDTLGSQNALIPIAYWLGVRGVGVEDLRKSQHSKNRRLIKTWLIRSLLKRGFWGGASDTMLSRLRSVLQVYDGEVFPVEELWQRATGSSWENGFSEDEIQQLVDLERGHRNSFAILSMLYDFVDVTNNTFHIDHVFPKSRLNHNPLEALGFHYEDRMEMRHRMNRLPNLQLLNGTMNQEKSKMLPKEWLETKFATSHSNPDHAVAEYAERHDLGELPDGVDGFIDWYETRRDAMRTRLHNLLGQRPPS